MCLTWKSGTGSRGCTPVVADEFRQFLDFVEGNLGRSLVGGASADEFTSPDQSGCVLWGSRRWLPAAGSSFFSVTVSVMDEMSRKSPAWSYIISSRPLMPPAEDVSSTFDPGRRAGSGAVYSYAVRNLGLSSEDFRRSRTTSLIIALTSLWSGPGADIDLQRPFHPSYPSTQRGVQPGGEWRSRLPGSDNDVKMRSACLVGGFNHMVERLKQNKDMQQALYRQERLSSLGKLAAGIAHEIKNPLNAISLSLAASGRQAEIRGVMRIKELVLSLQHQPSGRSGPAE